MMLKMFALAWIFPKTELAGNVLREGEYGSRQSERAKNKPVSRCRTKVTPGENGDQFC